MKIRLGEIAHARSGDKGSGANIGVIGYKPEGYTWLRENLTAEKVQDFFAAMGPGDVARYDVPNLEAVNFVLPAILAGGGSRSLRVDAQGKTLGQVLLEMEIEVEAGALETMRKPG